MTNQRQKQSSALPMAARMASGQNEQQQQQAANHSSDDAEIARCFTPFSHLGLSQLKPQHINNSNKYQNSNAKIIPPKYFSNEKLFWGIVKINHIKR